MGVLKVFVKVISDVCLLVASCCYVLPELRAVLAILTACLLYFHTIFKLQELNQAILVDQWRSSLFSFKHVLFTLARQSKPAIAFGNFVVGTAHGIFPAAFRKHVGYLAVSSSKCLASDPFLSSFLQHSVGCWSASCCNLPASNYLNTVPSCRKSWEAFLPVILPALFIWEWMERVHTRCCSVVGWAPRLSHSCPMSC